MSEYISIAIFPKFETSSSQLPFSLQFQRSFTYKMLNPNLIVMSSHTPLKSHSRDPALPRSFTLPNNLGTSCMLWSTTLSIYLPT
jgi:hypothetical protein